MTTPDYTTTIGGTASTITITITDDGGPVDLTSASAITLRMRRGTDGELLEVDMTASVSADPTDGVIEHEWSDADYPADAGVYAAQLVIDFDEGTRMFVPNERVSGRAWYRFEFLAALS